jgi:RimJ/RimL family protein N-acetyltransferase
MCTIRRIQPDDWQKYKALCLEAVRLHPEAFGATYAYERAKSDEQWRERAQLCATASDHVILVADNQCQLVGMMGLHCETGKRSHVAIIWGVYVQADYRGQQLGCQLMQETLAWARRMNGVRKVRLEVNAINTPAHKLYLRNGFKETGRLREEMNSEGQYCDLIQMELFL